MASYFVYVVELRRPGSGPAVYVGSSAMPPEERFKKHKVGGYSTSGIVKRQGVRLLPHLYERINRSAGLASPSRRSGFPEREAAHEAERQLRKDLERRGYRVFGACTSSPNGCFF